jgi:hypothetical protein
MASIFPICFRSKILQHLGHFNFGFLVKFGYSGFKRWVRAGICRISSEAGGAGIITEPDGGETDAGGGGGGLPPGIKVPDGVRFAGVIGALLLMRSGTSITSPSSSHRSELRFLEEFVS